MAEKRIQPEVDYERQLNNEGYLAVKAETTHKERKNYEANLKLMRQTEVNGNAHAGRQQQGVTVLSGNAEAVYSDTRADGAKNKNSRSGVVWTVEELSKIEGSPISPGEDLPWEATSGSSGEHGSEM